MSAKTAFPLFLSLGLRQKMSCIKESHTNTAHTHTHVSPLLFHPKRDCANASSSSFAFAAADGKTECAGEEEGTHHHLLYFPYPSSSFAYQTPFGVQSQSNQPNSQPTAGGGPLLRRGGNCFLNTGEGRDGRSKDTLATG